MLKIKAAHYVKSAVIPSQYPEMEKPEIALVGRSNVGKSSLINTLVNRRNLARTSSQPGKTQTLNFYLVNDGWYFVDLPGYGYAKVSITLRDNWRKIIDRYLSQRTSLIAVWQLVDIRHPPTDLDQQMFQKLSELNLPRMVVATKLDKISRNQRAKYVKKIKDFLAIKENEIVLFSSQTGEGKEELLNKIETLLAGTGAAQ